MMLLAIATLVSYMDYSRNFIHDFPRETLHCGQYLYYQIESDKV